MIKLQKKRNYNLIIGCIITAIMVIMIIVGCFYTPYDPNAIDGLNKMTPPSAAHLLGTDNLGRDIFSRVLDGAGTTLFVAAGVVIIGAVGGILVGSLTGYFGGWIDGVLMRINDVLTAFPSFLLALVVISIIGTGKYNVIIALGILFIPSFSRMVRSEFVRCKNYDYVQSARLMGASQIRIMTVHILPNTFSVLMSIIAIGFNNAVLAEASMSYLGLGVQPPDASLGRMLSESQSYFLSAPWYSLSIGIVMILLILGFSLIGDGLNKRGAVYDA